jgi:hypothetical protein
LREAAQQTYRRSLLDLRGVTLHPAEDGGWVDLDTALLHHLGQITIADAVLAVPADAQQEDLDRATTAFEDRQQDRSSGSRHPLYCEG